MKKVMLNDNEISFDLRQRDDMMEIQLNGQTYSFQFRGRVGHYLYFEDQNFRMHRLMASPDAEEFLVEGERFHVAPLEISRKRKKKEDHGQMISPMPGKILKVYVVSGQKVEAGEALLVIEAMKMEHTIRATHAGIVDQVHFKEGDSVEGGVDLVDLTKDESHA